VPTLCKIEFTGFSVMLSREKCIGQRVKSALLFIDSRCFLSNLVAWLEASERGLERVTPKVQRTQRS